MTIRFVDLLELNANLKPGQQQQRATEEFPSVVQNSHMEIWRLGEELPTSGAHIWIGVASYSIPDLEMLDAIEAKLSREPAQNERIHLFDVSSFTGMRDFEKYLPGIGKVYQTPAIGIWEDGVLKEKASGTAAKNWLVRRYQLSD